MKFWTTISLILALSAVGLTYEIAAGRVLAPFFGTSLLTWTAVIATVLAGFSLGSALGGLVAEQERAAALKTVNRAVVATAVLMALSPIVLGFVYAMGARGTLGMLASVFLAFFPASVLVSLPSPLLAKMAVEARPGREGSSLGLVLAAGSVGAIFGAILAGFVTLPLIGSAATFAGCGAVMLLCLLFLRGANPMAAVSSGPAAIVVAMSLLGGPVCQYESGLSCIDVERQGSTVNLYSDRILQASERSAPAQTRTTEGPDLTMPYAQWIWSRLDKDLGPAPRVLFVGGGGYTLPTKLLASRPAARAVAVEIDPLITRTVRDRLPQASAMIAQAGYDAGPGPGAENAGRLGLVHGDGRVYINETDSTFDAVVMDAFSSASVPAHLATRETYARLKQIVDGPVYVNLIDAADGPLARGVHAILRELYPYVEIVQNRGSGRSRVNILIAAANNPLAELTELPGGFEPAVLTAALPFTDDKGWAGRW